jgi:hypothetical protein
MLHFQHPIKTRTPLILQNEFIYLASVPSNLLPNQAKNSPHQPNQSTPQSPWRKHLPVHLVVLHVHRLQFCWTLLVGWEVLFLVLWRSLVLLLVGRRDLMLWLWLCKEEEEEEGWWRFWGVWNLLQIADISPACLLFLPCFLCREQEYVVNRCSKEVGKNG